jgi:hypothetical protein
METVHYRVHKTPPPVPILSQINPDKAYIMLLEVPSLIVSSHLGPSFFQIVSSI